MSLLSELNTLLDALSIPVETGIFTGKAPETYVVITPLSDSFALHADDHPGMEVQEARLSLFSQGNYRPIKRQIEKALLAAGITITDRRYIGHEDDTGYHHLAIDTAKQYELEG
ncbi:MAG: hypothetical protein VB104_11295 [Candidatus Limiplasma sp.]|nr:hypothetical protein [Candidatus Limiplasma sp.]